MPDIPRPGPVAGIIGGATREPSRSRRAAEVDDLVRLHLGLPDAAVTVSQLACPEPGCPPVETVIAVLATPQRRWTIHARSPRSTTSSSPACSPTTRTETSMTDRRIPVTVLTGFLGSGKTTLLNRILTEQHGRRIAVIENEFGEVGIDDALVLNSEEEVFEMNNGCICCTVRGDLIRILGSLLRRKDRFDAIHIETTGLADPAPVAQTFFMGDALRARPGNRIRPTWAASTGDPAGAGAHAGGHIVSGHRSGALVCAARS